MRALVAYYSRTGHTEKVAQRLKAGLMEAGVDVELSSINSQKDISVLKGIWRSITGQGVPIKVKCKDLKEYDLICLGGPVWAGCPFAALNSFIDGCHNLAGKRFVLFLTLGSEGAGKALQKMADRVKAHGGEVLYSFDFSTGPKNVRLKGPEIEEITALGRKIAQMAVDQK